MADSSDPFFGAGVDPRDIQAIAVTARGEKALNTDAAWRNSLMVLSQWTKRLERNSRAAIAIMSIGASLFAGPVFASMGHLDDQMHLPKDGVITTSTQYTGLRNELIAGSTKKLKDNLSYFVIDSGNTLNNFVNPFAYTGTDATNAPGCYIGLAGVGDILIGADEHTKNLLRKWTSQHEFMHCEQFSQAIDRSVTNSSFNLGAAYINKVNKLIPLDGIHKVNFDVLYQERGADAGAFLRIAANLFKDANTNEKISSALSEFDQTVEAMLLVRSNLSKGIVNIFDNPDNSMLSELQDNYFDDHDTSGVIRAVQRMIHGAASCPDKIKSFVENELTPEKTMETSALLALGSIRDDYSKLISRQVEFGNKYYLATNDKIIHRINSLNLQLSHLNGLNKEDGSAIKSRTVESLKGKQSNVLQAAQIKTTINIYESSLFKNNQKIADLNKLLENQLPDNEADEDITEAIIRADSLIGYIKYAVVPESNESPERVKDLIFQIRKASMKNAVESQDVPMVERPGV